MPPALSRTSHLGTTNLRSLSDFKGQELIARVLALIDQYKPLENPARSTAEKSAEHLADNSRH